MELIIGFLHHLILGLIHLLALGLDVVFFFVFVRVLADRWPVLLFVNLDRAGSPVIEPLLVAVGKMFRGSSVQVKLLLLALLLILCRLGLTAIAQPLS